MFAGSFIGRAAPLAWKPDNLGRARLAAWWHADDHGTNRMTDDGSGLISSFTDRISGIALTATTTARPTWAAGSFGNGNAGLTFNGTANCLVGTDLSKLPTGAVDCELWALVQTVAGSGVVTLASWGGTTVGISRSLRRGATGILNVTDGSTSLSGTTANSMVGPHMIRAYWQGTTMGFDRDGGTSLGSTTFGNTAIGTTRIRIGATNATAAAGFAPFVLRQLLIIRGSLN